MRWATPGLAGDFKAAHSCAGFRTSSVCKGRFLKAVVISSGEKNAIPHKPTMPATPRQMPTSVLRRQRGCRNRSAIEPTALPEPPVAASALAFIHAWGSFRTSTIGTARMAGNTLTNDNTCQPL